MKVESLMKHFGYLSLLAAVVPLIIAAQSLSVNFGGNKPYIFPSLTVISLILGLFSFSKWQGKISVTLFLYFIYRMLIDPACLIYA